MPRRYIFGPTNGDFAEQGLGQQRERGLCLAFDGEGKTDLTIQDADSWAEVTTRFPAGWRPEFIVLNLAYAAIPNALWTVPVPIVGLAADWPLLWHYYRRRLRSCDLVLSDPAGVEALQLEGISQARAANLYGCDPDCLIDS